jgi:hypothetical protein
VQQFADIVISLNPNQPERWTACELGGDSAHAAGG